MVKLKLDSGGNIKRKVSDDFSENVKGFLDEDVEKETMRLVAWRIIPLFCVYLVVGSIEKHNLAYASEGLMDDLGLSDSQYGAVGSIFILSYALSTIPTVLLAKRTGARYALPGKM